MSWLADIGTFLVGIAAFFGVWKVSDWWKQRQSETKTRYLVSAYEALTDFAVILHHPKLEQLLGGESLNQSINRAMNNVQLFGSVKLAQAFAELNQLDGTEANIEKRRKKVEELRQLIRDEYRSELKLEPLTEAPRWDFWNFKGETK